MSRVTRVQEEEVDWEEVEDGDTVYSFSRAAAECRQCGGSSSRHNIFGTEVRSGAVSELYSALCRTGATPHQLCWEPIYVELTKDYKSKTLSHKLTCINSGSIYNENLPKLVKSKIIGVSEEL